jgi:hypothetical protein
LDTGGQVGIIACAYDGGVEICIRDDGRGLSDEVKARIFEPFMRLVSDFYEQLYLSINQAVLSEDCQTAEAMHGDGYSYADLEYAVRWTARNIPSARRFNMVRLSIEEAFKDQWNI